MYNYIIKKNAQLIKLKLKMSLFGLLSRIKMMNYADNLFCLHHFKNPKLNLHQTKFKTKIAHACGTLF